MTTTTTRKSRAQRAAEQADQDQAQQQPEPKPAEPYAVVTSEVAPITYYRPSVRVTMPDGESVETFTCEHSTWWHTTPEIAERCGRKLAASRGLRVAK